MVRVWYSKRGDDALVAGLLVEDDDLPPTGRRCAICRAALCPANTTRCCYECRLLAQARCFEQETWLPVIGFPCWEISDGGPHSGRHDTDHPRARPLRPVPEGLALRPPPLRPRVDGGNPGWGRVRGVGSRSTMTTIPTTPTSRISRGAHPRRTTQTRSATGGSQGRRKHHERGPCSLCRGVWQC